MAVLFLYLSKAAAITLLDTCGHKFEFVNIPAFTCHLL